MSWVDSLLTGRVTGTLCKGLLRGWHPILSSLVIQAVLHDVVIGASMEETLKDRIANGTLIQVLRDWCPSFPGYFLYHPSRRNQPAGLAALIETLRFSD
jgi:DNA-binding transcriptional LysR family regulator